MFEEYKELIGLSKLALDSSRKHDAQLFLRRLSRRLRSLKPEVSSEIDALLSASATGSSPLRTVAAKHLPVDSDSRLHLARPEYPVVIQTEPIWSDGVVRRLDQILSERLRGGALSDEGLHPTKSVLLTGAPGVGKSLAAKWIAHKLDKPLVTLDLSAVMSSYLGKTGANVRQVLEYAKTANCVLLLDEFDAVAKRRDDTSEIGELKRLVTVLLQEIDEWPPTGLLIAATNHPDLLDPAVWRRFEAVIEFPMPTGSQTVEAINKFIGERDIDPSIVDALGALFEGMSFSDIEREILRARRESVVGGIPLQESLKRAGRDHVSKLSLKAKKEAAVRMTEAGFSQYEAKEWTGVHRSTIRNAMKPKRPDKG